MLDGQHDSRPAPTLAPSAAVDHDGHPSGRYVYCIAPGSEPAPLEEAGIDGAVVYPVAWRDLHALVHDGPAEPYQVADPALTAERILRHHQIVTSAWQRLGAILPMRFNTVIVEDEVRGVLAAWLEENYSSLRAKQAALAGKAEYGVQVFWETAVILRETFAANPEIRQLEADLASLSRGTAYLRRQQVELIAKREVDARALRDCQGLTDRLRRCVDLLRVEKPRQAGEGQQQLLNLACLVSRERETDLMQELAQIDHQAGYAVRLVGPMPPYSFCSGMTGRELPG